MKTKKKMNTTQCKLSLNVHHADFGDVVASNNSMPFILTFMFDGEIDEMIVITSKELHEVLVPRLHRIRASMERAIQLEAETLSQKD